MVVVVPVFPERARRGCQRSCGRRPGQSSNRWSALTPQPPPEPAAHQATTCCTYSIGAECGSRCRCLANAIDGSVERRVEVGDAGLWVIVEGAVVATEWGVAEHALDGAEAGAEEGVQGRGEDGGGVQLGLPRSGGFGHEELLQLGAYNEESRALSPSSCATCFVSTASANSSP